MTLIDALPIISNHVPGPVIAAWQQAPTAFLVMFSQEAGENYDVNSVTIADIRLLGPRRMERQTRLASYRLLPDGEGWREARAFYATQLR